MVVLYDHVQHCCTGRAAGIALSGRWKVHHEPGQAQHPCSAVLPPLTPVLHLCNC